MSYGDFEIIFFYLLNNAVFGKTLENFPNHCNITLTNNLQKLMQVTQPIFKSFKIFDEKLVAVK